MVTEVVEIQIRDRGARATSNRIRNIGRSAGGARTAVVALLGSLGAFAAFRGLKRIAGEAIQASASFEQYGVRLRGLLGSQEEANRALETFTELSSRTPFAVSQIVEGSTALAAAALGNRERLEELTETAANLAAVTGLSFQEASSNLARSLAAGIGAADLFRERGVRALIEEIEGIPDATKLSTQELDVALRNVFGRGGTFGESAENLSLTLGGALSNIGDAATNLRVAIGDALSPVVINAARNIFIPFLQNLQALVVANANNISKFAAGALTGLIDAFILAAETGLNFANAGVSIQKFIRTLTGALFDAQLGIAEFDLSLNRALNTFGLVSDEDLAFQQNEVDLLRAGVDAIAEDVGRANRATGRFQEGLSALRDQLSGLKELTANTDFTEVFAPEGGPSVDDLTGGRDESSQTSEELKEIEDAQRNLLKLGREIELRRREEIDPLERQRALIDEQIAQVTELARITGEQALGERLINELIAQRARLGQEDERSGPGIGEQIGNAIRDGFSTGFDEALEGGNLLDSFGGNIADTLRESGNKGLREGFEASLKGMENQLEGVFESVAGLLPDIFGDAFEGLGAGLGQALGAGLQLLASEGLNALLGGSNSSQRSSGGLASSAVTSQQAVRGIIAGPQEIAIAQVGNNIADAVSPLVDLTTISNRILSEIRDTIRGAGGGFSALDANLDDVVFRSASVNG